MDDRFSKYEKEIPNLDIGTTYLLIDADYWKKPRSISIQNLGGSLNIKINEDLIADRNVTAVEYNNQDESPELPPNSFKVSTKAHLAIDKDYLYIWIPALNKWKRIILSEW